MHRFVAFDDKKDPLSSAVVQKVKKDIPSDRLSRVVERLVGLDEDLPFTSWALFLTHGESH